MKELDVMGFGNIKVNFEVTCHVHKLFYQAILMIFTL